MKQILVINIQNSTTQTFQSYFLTLFMMLSQGQISLLKLQKDVDKEREVSTNTLNCHFFSFFW